MKCKIILDGKLVYNHDSYELAAKIVKLANNGAKINKNGRVYEVHGVLDHGDLLDGAWLKPESTLSLADFKVNLDEIQAAEVVIFQSKIGDVVLKSRNGPIS